MRAAVSYRPLAFHLCADCVVLCVLWNASQPVCCLVKQIKKYNLKYWNWIKIQHSSILNLGAFVLGENDFRKSFSPKSTCLAAMENEIFWKFISIDQYLLLWPGNNFTLLFSVQIIFGKREREREREREKRAQIGERDRKKREPAINEGRDRPTSEKREPAIAPLVDHDCERARRSTSGVIVRRATSGAIVRRAHSSIAIVDRVARRTIAPISLLPHDLVFSSAARSQFDRIWWIFLLGFVSSVNECGIDSLSACLQLRKCVENWACKAFSVKIFEWIKHRN